MAAPARLSVALYAAAGFTYGLILVAASVLLISSRAWFPGAVYSAPLSLFLGSAAAFLAPALWAALFVAAAAAGRRAFIAAVVLILLQNLSAAPIWLAAFQTVMSDRADGRLPGLLSTRHLFVLLLAFAGQAAFLVATRRATRE